MQENLREFSKKTVSALKTACAKAIGVIKNYAYILIPVILLLSVGIIARTQEDPFQVEDFTLDNEEAELQQEFSSDYELVREIPAWVKPARWFRSNSGGMPLEEMKSRIAAMRGEYALVIDFAASDDLPEYLRNYYDENFYIEIRTLYKEGKEDRVQWIFRDENYGVRLIAVLFEAEQEEDEENIEAAPVDEAPAVIADVIQDTDDGGNEIIEANISIINNEEDSDIIEKPAKKKGPRGFIEIYDDAYHLTTEYRYSDTGEESKIDYFYKDNIKISAVTMFWDDEKENYVQAYTDYYRYNRSLFLRAVERVFLRDQKIKSAENVVAGEGEASDGVASSGAASSEPGEGVEGEVAAAEGTAVEGVVGESTAGENIADAAVEDTEGESVASNGAAKKAGADGDDENDDDESNIVRVSFPHNILAAAKNNFFMGEKFNTYPDFFGDLIVLKGSRLLFTTDRNGKVLDQTLINNDEEQTVIWKIVNTWSNDRILKVTKVEGDTVLLAEYEYNKKGDRVLERNFKDGVLERVVRSDGKTDIEELYQNNKVVLKAVWEDGRKISESRIIQN